MSRVLKTFAVLAACVALGVPACHGTISGGPPASSNQGLGGLTPSPQPGAGGAGGGASFSSGDSLARSGRLSSLMGQRHR